MANPTTNYGFVLPTSSDLVTDLPADFDVALQGVDTRLKALQPGTTLGDLAYSSATANTNTRLAVGSTGDVLTVSGGVPTWSAPAAAATSWSLLNAGGTSLSGAQTITVSGISGKNQIMVLLTQASSAASSSIIGIRLNTDTGNNYYRYGAELEATATYDALALRAVQDSSNNIQIGKLSTAGTGSSYVSGGVTFTGCNSSGVKAFESVGTGHHQFANTHVAYWLQGYYNSATVISSISVFSSTGNFDGGTVFVYTSVA